MKINDIIMEMTSAGAVAAVAQPMGKMIRRKKKKTDEREMTGAEKRKEDRLKKKYDDSEMKADMKKQYGDRGEEVYYATLRKKAMTKGAK